MSDLTVTIEIRRGDLLVYRSTGAADQVQCVSFSHAPIIADREAGSVLLGYEYFPATFSRERKEAQR